MLVRNIQVFISFANFYQCFIQSFNRIAILLIFLLKIIELSNLVLKVFRADENKIVIIGGSRANRMVVNSSKNKKSKKLTRVPNIKVTGKLNFLISSTKKVFNHLWLAFIKAPILQHFDLENHIRIETDVLGYAIG